MSKETEEEELRKQIADMKVSLIAIIYAPIFAFALFAIADYFGWLY